MAELSVLHHLCMCSQSSLYSWLYRRGMGSSAFCRGGLCSSPSRTALCLFRDGELHEKQRFLWFWMRWKIPGSSIFGGCVRQIWNREFQWRISTNHLKGWRWLERVFWNWKYIPWPRFLPHQFTWRRLLFFPFQMAVIRCLMTAAILWSICCNLILVEKIRHLFLNL